MSITIPRKHTHTHTHTATGKQIKCERKKQRWHSWKTLWLCSNLTTSVVVFLDVLSAMKAPLLFHLGCKHCSHRGHISSHQCCGVSWKALRKVLHNSRQPAACSYTWVTYGCLCYWGIQAGWVWNVCFDFRGIGQGTQYVHGVGCMSTCVCVCVCVYVREGRVRSRQITLTCLASVFVFNSPSMAKN